MLLELLAEAQELGFVGPVAIGPQLSHAEALVAALLDSTTAASASGGASLLGENPDGASLSGTPPQEDSSMLADLGSGGGLPGLVLVLRMPASAKAYLVEARERRAVFLGRSLRRLRAEGQASVLHCRAEDLGRDPAFRGRLSGITARSFASPAATAECAAPLLRPGGILAVSDPPGGAGDRWPADALAALGLSVVERRGGPVASLTVMRQSGHCPGRYPRRPGVPAKRPLF